MPRRIGDARQPLLLSNTVMDEKVLIWPARHMSGIMTGYSVRDSYLRRDPRVSQHTLDGQTAAVLVAGVSDFVLFVNKSGALVVFARHCDFW